MSSIYTTEPPTKGKVLIKTTIGDLDLELWSKEAPKACRNFLQLCMEGYYDNCIFHRIIKNFMTQTGDPTGTGEGGESIYGKPFKDEFHSRLKFSRRGIVGMANNGPNTNNSQFFISLQDCQWLNQKHTIFGKVNIHTLTFQISGNTVFNILSVNDCEVDDNDRPLNPPSILSTEILYEPFGDIFPRDIKHSKGDENIEKKEKKEVKKKIKNVSLLSFGDDEEENIKKKVNTKIKSSHDILNDPKLLKKSVLEEKPDISLKKRKEKKKKQKLENIEKVVDIDIVTQRKEEKKKEFEEKYTKLKKDIIEINKRLAGPEKIEEEESGILTALEQRRQRFLNIKRNKTKKRNQEDTMDKLDQFRQILQYAYQEKEKGGDENNNDDEISGGKDFIEAIKAESLPEVAPLLGEEVEETDEGWMTHKVKFVRHIDDIGKLDDYSIVDPRESMNRGFLSQSGKISIYKLISSGPIKRMRN